MRGLIAPQNTFLDTIATRFDGTREYMSSPRIPFILKFLLCAMDIYSTLFITDLFTYSDL